MILSDVDMSCNETGNVRLTHFGMDTKGRLEVCSDGYWGSACREYDDKIAAVVCRQLGYFPAGQWIHIKDHTFLHMYLHLSRPNVQCVCV